MSSSYRATGHQPVEPDHGADDVPPTAPKDERGPSGAPHRKHNDPEDPAFADET